MARNFRWIIHVFFGSAGLFGSPEAEWRRNFRSTCLQAL